MMISQSQIQALLKIYQNQGKIVPGEKKPEKNTPAGRRDEVILSTQGLEIGAWQKLARNTGEVREARVRELQTKIQSGTYNVSGEDIAEKMLGRNLVDRLL